MQTHLGVVCTIHNLNKCLRKSIQQYISSNSDTAEGGAIYCPPSIVLMEAEAALYWGIVYKHLQSEARALGSDAAATVGTEAEVYAAEASGKNDLLENCWFDCH